MRISYVIVMRSSEVVSSLLAIVFFIIIICRLFQVDNVMGVSKTFFSLPEHVKKSFSRGSFSCNENHGWVSVETERRVHSLVISCF